LNKTVSSSQISQYSARNRGLIINKEIAAEINDYVVENNGLVNASKIQEKVLAPRNTYCSATTIYKALHKLGFNKAKTSTIPKTCNNNIMAKSQQIMLSKYISLIKDGFNPVCIDETGYTVGLNLQYCWKKSNTPLARVNTNPQYKINFICATSYCNLVLIEGHQGPTNQLIFSKFIFNLLKNINIAQRETGIKYFIFLDNAQYHKTRYIKGIISKFNVPCLYNSSYSCEFNPIEQIFNICKTELRKKMPKSLYRPFSYNE
jgi:hypothetical protein